MALVYFTLFLVAIRYFYMFSMDVDDADYLDFPKDDKKDNF